MSNELAAKVDAATTRLLVVQKEYADAEASANAHEREARADRLRMTELKKEREELNTVLRHSKVQQSVDSAQAAAAQAQAKAQAAQLDAEKIRIETGKVLDELRAKSAEMDKAIATANAKSEEAAALMSKATETPVHILEQCAQPAD